MEYELMNVSYNTANGYAMGWRVSKDVESDGMFYLNDRKQICIETNGRTLDEVKVKMGKLISMLGEGCMNLIEEFESWETFENLEVNFELARRV